eukprot:s2951_g13.t1
MSTASVMWAISEMLALPRGVLKQGEEHKLMTRPWRLGRLGAFAALVVVAVAQETQERSPPDLEGLFEFVSGPLVAHWLSDTAVPQLAKKDFPCMKLMILLDWVAQKYHNSFAQSKAELNLWKVFMTEVPLAQKQGPDSE